MRLKGCVGRTLRYFIFVAVQ